MAILPAILPRRLASLISSPAILFALVTGCQSVITAPPDAALEKLLRPATTAADVLTLEVLQARIPMDEDPDFESAWQGIDEQCFDAELRRRLHANGLRAGVVGAAIPAEIARLLDMQSQLPEATDRREITAQSALARVTRRIIQVNRREPKIIKPAELRSGADVLVADDGRLTGESFEQVEGVYSLTAESIAGQRAALRLVPELHHGELRNRVVGAEQGIFQFALSREREAFDRLTVRADLAPGEMLVIGCLPQADASLGGVLHTIETGGRRERRILMIRLLETPASEILAKN